ncbi:MULTISPECIES: hypothetical protein [Pseudomonas]|uniref:Cthe-2314-like HEPN domain-containing protein n=1 Tax=Pseudomonas cerasi TaxID=1583341 RepID=A0A193SJZ3_9PSED|nr:MULTISPECIES: hypothetical protein [Pseudomonas]KWS14423.1 hypothetical protein AL065_28975 [Pseudomonas amygdali pv. ulmi]CZT27350.1 hypothetical protein PCPL58_0894 [Pseudomonas cerasi]SOS14636.1 hypothetical protein PL963_00366 [Pseudomonas cerasi]
MATDEQEPYTQEHLAAVIRNAVAYVANEAVVLGNYERIQTDQFPQLWPPNDDGQFDKRMNLVVRHLGGPPEHYLLRTGETAPLGDLYPETSMAEVFDVFKRARKSVIRAHLFMVGSKMLIEQPEMIEQPESPEVAAFLVKNAQAAFWEHAEAAYIRLYSFWDRIGQVLDFAFFNIRKFDHNGFNAVMNRIYWNAYPMNSSLGKSISWKQLRNFQNSNNEDGLQFLLQRRNLLIHSLHLHPLKEEEEDVFKSQFNHLDAAHREKIRPHDPAHEVEILIGQLNKASLLFRDFLTLVELSPSRKYVHQSSI